MDNVNTVQQSQAASLTLEQATERYRLAFRMQQRVQGEQRTEAAPLPDENANSIAAEAEESGRDAATALQEAANAIQARLQRQLGEAEYERIRQQVDAG